MVPTVSAGRDLSWDQYEIALSRNGFRHGPCGFVIDEAAQVAVRVTVLDSRRGRLAFAIQARERILSTGVSRSRVVQDEIERLRAQSQAMLHGDRVVHRQLDEFDLIAERYRGAARRGEGLARLELDLIGLLSTVKALRRLGGGIKKAAFPADTMRAAL